MRVIILHNPHSEASRALMAEMGVDPLTDAEAIQAPNGWTVTGRESYATLVCPSFSAYPTCVVILDDGRMRVKSPVESLAECEAFVDNTPALSRTMTKYSFRTRVLTFAERMTMDNSTIPELVTMRNDLFAAEAVDLDEVAKYKPVMLATSLATEARINEIIAGVTHE